MVALYIVFLVLIAAERIVELRISSKNAARAFERGGVEYGQKHFVAMKLLHTLFFFGCGLEVLFLHRPFVPTLGAPMLALALAAQGLRYWAVTSLGKCWNVRVILVPDRPAVTRGPYKYLRHPNYLAVVIEGVAIPLIHSAWLTAIVFSVLNAIILTIRIRCEEKALAQHSDYQSSFGDKRRFLPRARKEP